MNDFVEYTFRIIGPSPKSIPMSRLALYMGELARLMGAQDEVHFDHLKNESVGIVAIAPVACVPIISPRIREASKGSPDSDAYSPWKRINDYLSQDGWTAEMPLPNGGEKIQFLGNSPTVVPLRSITQRTSIQGRLVRVEGGGDTVKVGLEVDGSLTARVSLDAIHALELAKHFHQFVRLNGEGKWKRDIAGTWSLDSLNATSFEVLVDAPLNATLEKLREIIPSGSGKNIAEAINELRRA
jgi:hypothetical protein